MTVRTTFLPHEHLRRPQDFQVVYDRRRSASNDWLIVYGRDNGLPHHRLGLSVSRKWGGAVQRNRLRRLYREAFRLSRHDLPPGLDLVLVPRRADPPPLLEMQAGLVKLVRHVAGKLARDPVQS